MSKDPGVASATMPRQGVLPIHLLLQTHRLCVQNETIFVQAALSKICEFTVDSLPRLRYAQAAHTGEVPGLLK